MTCDRRRRSTEKRSPTRCARGMALASKTGVHPSTDQLARMLEALSLASQPPERPGRLTELVQPSGFEALAGITPAASDRPSSMRRHSAPAPGAAGPRLVTSAPSQPQPAPAGTHRHSGDERRQAAEALRREKALSAARSKAEKRIQAAERELAHAREAFGRAERALEEARGAVEEAERKLATARADRVLSSPHV